jgi:hypothetical protein
VIDPRLRYDDYTPGMADDERAGLQAGRAASAERRRAELRTGTPQLIAVASINMRDFPDASQVPFIAATSEAPGTADEYDDLCYLVRVFPDDAVELAQSRAQMWEQARLVGQGYVGGEIDDDGNYVGDGDGTPAPPGLR